MKFVLQNGPARLSWVADSTVAGKVIGGNLLHVVHSREMDARMKFCTLECLARCVDDLITAKTSAARRAKACGWTCKRIIGSAQVG